MEKLKFLYDDERLPVTAPGIIRIQAASNYSCIYFEDGSNMIVAKILRWFQLSLPDQMFVRVHKSLLVNKHFIKNVAGISKKTIILNNGESIVISRRKRTIAEIMSV
jgi:two-component system LytT family response regulator